MLKVFFVALGLSSLFFISSCTDPAVSSQSAGEQSNLSSPVVDVTPQAFSHDFGEIQQGDDVTHVFHLENRGATTVRFEQPALVDMGCCMTAVLSSDQVEPSQTTELKVTVRTRLKPGPFDWRVQLFPTDPEFPQEFRITGKVSESLVIEPIQLSFKKRGELDFIAKGNGLGATHKISRVVTNSPHLKIRLSESSKDGPQLVNRYTVTWDGEPIVQRSTPAAYVITDSKKLQWFPILINTPKSANSP